MSDAYDAALKRLSDELSEKTGRDVTVEQYMVDAFDGVEEHVTYEDGLLRPELSGRLSGISYTNIASEYVSTMQREAPDPSTEEAIGYLAALGVNLSRSAAPDDPDKARMSTFNFLLPRWTSKFIAITHREVTEGKTAAARDCWNFLRDKPLEDRDVYGIPYSEDPERGAVRGILNEGILTGAEIASGAELREGWLEDSRSQDAE